MWKGCSLHSAASENINALAVYVIPSLFSQNWVWKYPFRGSYTTSGVYHLTLNWGGLKLVVADHALLNTS